MTGLMLFGNLRSTWDATIQEHISTIVNRTFRKMSGEDYEKEVPRGFIDTGHTNYMKQLGQFFSVTTLPGSKRYICIAHS